MVEVMNKIYCSNCSKKGLIRELYKLVEPNDFPVEGEDKWLQCYECGTKYLVYL